MNTLQHALHWLDLGIAPIPCFYRDKRPKFPWRDYQDTLPTRGEVVDWFTHQFCNLALITGWQGLTVLDFDNIHVYELWRNWAARHAPLVADISYKVFTARGVHVYVALEERLPGAKKLGLVDVKAYGGYVLAPPSVHPSGRPYQAENAVAPIIQVESLTSVLPAEMLELEQPEPIPTIRLGTELQPTPWQAAMYPARIQDGDSPISSILDSHTLFELFPNARKKGGKYWVPCPLHPDTNPSLAIDPDGKRGRCWAGCTPAQGFDYINFYAALNGMTNSEAIQVLS